MMMMKSGFWWRKPEYHHSSLLGISLLRMIHPSREEKFGCSVGMASRVNIIYSDLVISRDELGLSLSEGFTPCRHLRPSAIQLLMSTIHLVISSNHLVISPIQLLISTIHLVISTIQRIVDIII